MDIRTDIRRLILAASAAALTTVAGASALRAQQPTTPAAADSDARPDEPERWQVKLADGSYRWELRLVRVSARGDTLIVRQAGVTRPDSLVAFPIDSVDELQLVQKSEQRVGRGARGAQGSLTGADDVLYPLWKLEPTERRRVILQIVREHLTEPTPVTRPN